MKIYIVLPAYNEEEALTPLVKDICQVMTEEGRDFEVLIVNDGSQDGTLAVARRLAEKYPMRVFDNGVNMGLAETLKNGLIEALRLAGHQDIVITMDADNTHPAGLCLRMVRLIREGNDVVIASRYREGSFVRGLSLFRRFLSFGASWLFRLLFPMHGVRDYTCGFRAYRASVLHELQTRYGDTFISERGFSCMVDILLRIRETDAICAEVPLVLRYDQKPGRSKMRVFKTIGETLWLAVRRRLGMNSGPVEARRAT